MNKHEIIFKLNEQEKIVLEAVHPVEDLHCCYKAPIVFLSDNNSYLLSEFDLQKELEIFKRRLEAAFNNQLKFSLSGDDIGYFYNQEAHENLDLVYEKLEKYWVWSSSTEIRTWLYNDADGNIILEITPAYPWLYYDADEHPEGQPNYILYEEWINNYKPFVVRKIPRDVAKKWLEQADNIIKKIDENMASGE